MTPVAGVNDFDAGRDADFALITEYVTHRASPEAMRTMNRRYRTEAGFRAKAEPIIAIWTLPFLEVELTESGEAIVQPAKDRFSKPSRQAVWDGFHASLGLPSIPVDEIDNDHTDPLLYFPKLRHRRRWKRIITVFLLGILIFGGGGGYIVWGISSAWKTSNAEVATGREVTLTAPIWTPNIWETKAGEERRVELEQAVITLHSASRLSVGGPTSITAVDGEMAVEVVPRKMLVVIAAGVNFYLKPGRYRVTHPIGKSTTIVVDTGRVKLRWPFAPKYVTGTTMTVEANGRTTLIRAVRRDGTAFPLYTQSNRLLIPDSK